MQGIELYENEEIKEKYKGVFWENTFLFLYEKQEGEIILTNLRVIFNAKLFNKNLIEAQILYSDIQNIAKCNVGSIIPLNPTGICIDLKNGQTCKLSSFRREKIINLINQMKEVK